MANVKLGSKSVGSIVKLKIGGVLTDFIVVHQGNPDSSIYDASCSGTWLLMKDCYEKRQWNSSNVNSLETSDIHNDLNSTFLAKIDTNIQAQIKQVKIPYRQNGGSGGTDRSGANGLPCKIFLLSAKEVGFSDTFIPNDGAKLDYFNSGNGTATKRVAYLNGSAPYWWLRSPYTSSTVYVWVVNSAGQCDHSGAISACGVRPALVLPTSLMVSDSGAIVTNTAPTTPSKITVPSTIHGGSTITLSWSASTDTDSNLDGYIVERSTNGGSTWSQIYQGSATSTTNTVPKGTETVMYRVKAYDTDGAASGYRTSSQVTVINNSAPSAPTAITVPTLVFGGSTLDVAWTASTDPDGNLTGYALERQVDGGAWSQVFQGDALKFTDTITRGWTSVAYRVRAFDAYEAFSDYATSPARTVNNNLAPVITCDLESGSDLGTKSDGFQISYSVGDEDGDPVAVTEAVDGKTLRAFDAVLGEACTFDLSGEDFMRVLNGNHELTLSADDGKVKAVHKLTFAKLVSEAGITLKKPFPADDKISICVLSVTGSIPADAGFSVEVTNNALDDEPAWEDCTVEVHNGGNHVFANDAAQNGFAFNFRVSVKRGESGVGGYISSVQGGFQ